jgi:molybdopterin-guanine dinucleotide biosynthesis protein A
MGGRCRRGRGFGRRFGEDTVNDPADATIGIVLAGGGSSRLGAAGGAGGKAWLALDGRTFLERVVAAITGEVGTVIVVAAAGQALPDVPAARIVRDRMPAAGPLSAVADGLRAAVAEATSAGVAPPRLAIVASCDLPLVRPAVVRLLVARGLASDAAWTVPQVHGHPQVLLSAARPHVLPRIEAWLAAGRRDLRGLVRRLADENAAAVDLVPEEAFATVDPGLDSFADIDTPADLEWLRDHSGGGRCDQAGGGRCG